MYKNILVTALLLIPVVLSAQNNQSPRDIMIKSMENSKLRGLESKTRLEIHDGKGNQRTRVTSMASRVFDDGTEKRVIIFVSPADVKGTGMLIFDHKEGSDDMWIHLPALRKTRKIVSSEKSKSFMGSEFSNSDLSIGSIDDFTYQHEGEETVEGEKCWKIIILPKNEDIEDENGITKKVMWISQRDFMPRKAVFYDLDKELWKEMRYSGIKLLDKEMERYIVSHMEIKNLQNKRYSIMDMEEVKFNPSVPVDFFTTSFLERR